MDLQWWIATIAAPLVASLFAADIAIHFRAAAAAAKCHARIDAMERDGYQYRLAAAQQYATIALVSEVERRMLAAIERIDGKLDRLIERNQEKDRAA